jgi:hypothetical protein
MGSLPILIYRSAGNSGKELLTKKLSKMGFPKNAFLYWVFEEKIWMIEFWREFR